MWGEGNFLLWCGGGEAVEYAIWLDLLAEGGKKGGMGFVEQHMEKDWRFVVERRVSDFFHRIQNSLLTCS